jgi:predicted transcriptional regulator
MKVKNFHKNVKILFFKTGLTQVEFAEKSGISQSAMSKMMGGKLEPRLETIIKIVKTFDTSFENLLKDTKE